jgi:hypothetical protein
LRPWGLQEGGIPYQKLSDSSLALLLSLINRRDKEGLSTGERLPTAQPTCNNDVSESYFMDDELASPSSGTPSRKKKILMVCIVGGVTFLEIAAFRYLSNDPSFPYTILIATTAMVNGSTFLDSLSHRF